MTASLRWLAWSATLACAGAAQAACLGDAEVQALMNAYVARQPAVNADGLSTADGECARAKLLKRLDASFGVLVGYKAGMAVSVQYLGLPGDPVVNLSFKP